MPKLDLTPCDLGKIVTTANGLPLVPAEPIFGDEPFVVFTALRAITIAACTSQWEMDDRREGRNG